jgi:hypothetical protein
MVNLHSPDSRIQQDNDPMQLFGLQVLDHDPGPGLLASLTGPLGEPIPDGVNQIGAPVNQLVELQGPGLSRSLADPAEGLPRECINEAALAAVGPPCDQELLAGPGQLGLQVGGVVGWVVVRPAHLFEGGLALQELGHWPVGGLQEGQQHGGVGQLDQRS